MTTLHDSPAKYYSHLPKRRPFLRCCNCINYETDAFNDLMPKCRLHGIYARPIDFCSWLIEKPSKTENECEEQL